MNTNFYTVHGYCSGIPGENCRQRLNTLVGRTKWIRGYSVGGYNVHRMAKSMGFKTAVGAWLGRNFEENEKQLAGLIDEAKAGFVDLAIIGSETLFRRDLTDAELAKYIERFKKSVPNVPVSVCDVADMFCENRRALAASDVVGVSIYPYWEGVSVEKSVKFLSEKYQKIARMAGKEVLISETGWPSAGNTIGDAVANPENALRYFKEFVEWATRWNVRYFYFASFDESWKKEFEGEQGGHWGRWYEDGTEKPWVNWR